MDVLSTYEAVMTVLCIGIVVAGSYLETQRRNQSLAPVVQLTHAVQREEHLWTWAAGQPKELMELAARSNGGGTAVIPDPQPLDDHDGTIVGDLIEAPAEPVLEAHTHQMDVYVNFTRARERDGQDCIHVDGIPANGIITAAMAHNLMLDLGAAKDTVSQIRTAAGFDS